MKKYKLAYFISHPIQYQVPLYKQITENSDIDLKVFFQSDISLREFDDVGFGRKIKWDIDLLDGYNYQFLNVLKKDNNKLGLFSPIVTGIYSALKSQKWDAVWFHGYNNHSILWAMLLCKMMKIPFFMRMESNLVNAPKGRFVKDLFINWILKNAAGLLYVSSDNKNYYLEYSADKNKLFSVPYTVDNAFFQNKILEVKDEILNTKKKIGLVEDYPIILYASKLTTRKRSTDLLNSFIKLSKDGKTPPNAYLVFIGDGEERENLQKVISNLDWNSHIKMLGFKNQTELPLFFAMCDIFVLPSQNEPFGLIVNEVMNAAKPIIVTNEVGCAKDIIQDCENGYIIEPKDIEDLSSKLKILIDNKELREKMGKKSLEIINNWSYNEDIDGIREALKNLK